MRGLSIRGILPLSRRCLGTVPSAADEVERIQRLSQYRAMMREVRGRFTENEAERVVYDEEMASAERAVVELEKRERAEAKTAKQALKQDSTEEYMEEMRAASDKRRVLASSERAAWSAMRAERVERHLSDLEAASEGWVGVETETIEAAIDSALAETTEWHAWQMAEEDHLRSQEARSGAAE